MNKAVIAERFSKTISTCPHETNVQRQVADKMVRLLQEYIPPPCPKVIESGYGTGIYSRMLLRTLRPEELLLNDLCSKMRYCCEDLLREKQVSFLSGDIETIPFPDKSTLITSCPALQWFESPEEFFKKCSALLHSQGYFAFSAFGKKNMKGIRKLTGGGLPCRSKEELEAALFLHSDILHSEEELIPLSFEDPMKVLYHPKQTGVNSLSARSSLCPKHEKQTWIRRDLQHLCECYTQEFTQGASVSLVYHPIYIMAEKGGV